MLKKDQLKIGEKYHVLVELAQRSGYLAEVLVKNGEDIVAPLIIRTKALLPIPAKPKHDPCRKFRTGDKVRIVEWNGRIPQYLADCIGSEHTVRYDEDINGGVHIVGDIDRTLACFLELVTPVEELEPYHVETDPHGYHIENGVGLWVATYHDEIHPNAYQAAIDECARLNDRKEEQQ